MRLLEVANLCYASSDGCGFQWFSLMPDGLGNVTVFPLELRSVWKSRRSQRSAGLQPKPRRTSDKVSSSCPLPPSLFIWPQAGRFTVPTQSRRYLIFFEDSEM